MKKHYDFSKGVQGAHRGQKFVVISPQKDESATRVKGNPPKLTKKQLEYLQDQEDLAIARERWASFVRSGKKGYTIEDLENEI